MYKRNSGSAEVDILQNQFTAYLTKAFHNGRAQYLLKKNRLGREIATEDLQLFLSPILRTLLTMTLCIRH